MYRLDFAAKIRTLEGEKIIIIEIQKAKLMHDIIRFRRYLGKQYSDEKNSYTVIKNGKKISVGIPIISIYFLGEALDNIHGIPVLKINNQIIDLHSGLEIKIKENFIESLTHQSYIISIPDLSKKRRDELEILLSIFDQSTKSDNKHLLSIDDNLPEKYREVIRRLQKAAAEKGVRETMQVEDDFLSEMADYERQIETQYQTIVDTKSKLFEAEKQKEEAEKQKEEAEKQKEKIAEKLLYSEKQKEEAEKQKEEAEKQKEEVTQKLLNSEQKLMATIQKCLSKGMNIEEIADLLGISLAEVQNIQKK